MIKKMMKYVAKPIVIMTNAIIGLNHFPEPSKQGIIKPLFKGASKPKLIEKSTHQ